ncbi:hypothetical protein HT136_14530 [Novosphingobium profundi]|uniref:hypothetical protein n=1 Tax=Novosphingobium profundi TaxID=1774954 RepID=UPI001BD971DE|nr:hypothetical protein [Novosphingobium profundi]MBT0669581.1 hypothetical protein [Novosphingobium profundi]
MEETDPVRGKDEGADPHAAAIARLEAALTRLEAAAEHRINTHDALARRHLALRATVESTLGELDTLIARSAP